MKDFLYHYKAVVKRVIDGDTIVVDVDLGFSVVLRDQPVRLAKVNAPEKKGKTKAAGLAAKEALESKLSGKGVVIRTHRDPKDKYGRILALVQLDDESQLCVNDWLIAEGLAVPFMV